MGGSGVVRFVLAAIATTALLAAATVFTTAPTAVDSAGGSVPLHVGPLVIAHRGGAAEAPENTLVAFEHATRLGAHVLELDVQPSADGVPVVIHDATLERTTDCEGPVNALTVNELKRCNACAAFCEAHDFVALPTLDEVLAAFADADVALNVEIKNAPTDPHTFDPADATLLPAVVDAIRAHPEYVPHRILVSSFNVKTTMQLKEIAPGIPVALLTLNPADAHAESASAAATGHVAIQPSHEGLRDATAARFVEDAHALGLAVHAWTVDDAPTMRRLADAGVDGIITNEPSLMLDTFAP